MVLVQCIFSTLPIATKLVLSAVEPRGIATLRIVGSAALFASLKWSTGSERVTAPRDLAALAGLALLGVVVNQVLFLEGVKLTTAVHANILITTIPVFTLAVALVLGRERASLWKLLGIVFAGAGAVYLIASRGGGMEGASVAGDALIAVNALFYSSYLVLSKDLLRRYQPLTVVTYVFLFGALVVLPLGVPPLLRVDVADLTWRKLLVLAYIVALPSFVAYLLSIWALRHTASSLVAMYVYIQPVVTAFLAPAVLGERVTAGSGVAALLIFVGLAFATWGEQIAGRQLGSAFRPPAEGA
jgi:drug/metabolite transporter (DMT)-like permease